jgi:hypothetical protein
MINLTGENISKNSGQESHLCSGQVGSEAAFFASGDSCGSL